MLNFADTGGLFDHFEVNREPFWPRVRWLLGGSILWHLIIVACVVFIPSVRDALSLAAVFSGAGFVDRPYAHTEIGDADIIEFTTEKFHYPEGYFAMDQQILPPPLQYPPAMPSFKPASIVPSPSPSVSPTPTPAAGPSPAIAGNNDKGKVDSESKPSADKKAD